MSLASNKWFVFPLLFLSSEKKCTEWFWSDASDPDPLCLRYNGIQHMQNLDFSVSCFYNSLFLGPLFLYLDFLPSCGGLIPAVNQLPTSFLLIFLTWNECEKAEVETSWIEVKTVQQVEKPCICKQTKRRSSLFSILGQVLIKQTLSAPNSWCRTQMS